MMRNWNPVDIASINHESGVFGDLIYGIDGASEEDFLFETLMSFLICPYLIVSIVFIDIIKIIPNFSNLLGSSSQTKQAHARPLSFKIYLLSNINCRIITMNKVEQMNRIRNA